ncbi:MAG: LuxR C-terminal-related transcriptional regulator [Pigmentiphaga sp.]|nr:LuxR C-terminal-related transcriptional regulator [Pigmentiphaga sp.]
MYLNANQQRQLAQLLGVLHEFTDGTELRTAIGPSLLSLLRADQYVSYLWADPSQRYRNWVTPTMSADLLRTYDDYYYQYDCITPVMEAFSEPAIVEHKVGRDVMRRSVFYNEFLHQERMTSGINLYLRDAEGELGDFRIWRQPHRPAFDHEAVHLLQLLQPALCAALRRCQRAGDGRSVSAPSTPQRAAQGLSPRELAVARLAAQGLPDKQIARELAIGFTTVRTHLGNAYRKLGVDNRVGLARLLH